MNVLVIGASRIVQKRVWPALMATTGIESVHVASRQGWTPVSAQKDKLGRQFRDYGEALREVGPGVAYVSLPNGMHAKWVERALEAGFHVIVDKPAFTTFGDAERLVCLARRKHLCLAEATVWPFHPQIQAVRQVFEEAGREPTRVAAVFSFPPLNPQDFRCRSNMGGGSLFDLGPYAVSCGRIFFRARPDEVLCRITGRLGDSGVDTSFTIMARYPGGRSIAGHFGFDTVYRNSVILLAADVSVDIHRAFTLPADQENQLEVRRQSGRTVVRVGAADSFYLFLQTVLSDIEQDAFDIWGDVLEEDAHCLQQARSSAGETEDADSSVGLSY